MSFSTDTKTELCRTPIQKRCCAISEIYGVFLYAGVFRAIEIRVITGSEAFFYRIPLLLESALIDGFDTDLLKSKKGRKYSLEITDGELISRIFSEFGYDTSSTLSHHINLAKLEDDCCKKSFLRGAFLAGGSVTNPLQRYHLELATAHRSVSRELFSILLDMGFSPKDITRKGSYITYFKQSDIISDFLITIGAPISAMGIMSAKVEKDMRNAINRRVNCDNANADKIVEAAQNQLEIIRRIDREIGLSNLPDKLQDTALLRIANPEASLTDLAALASPPVSKSAMSHRVRKLLSYSEELAGT
jgi:DNA-binding protein WhiA